MDPSGNPVNKRVSVQNVFENIPTTVAFGGTAPQAITAQTTAPNITTTITTINTTGGGYHTGTISETNVVQGQIKHIVQIIGTNTSTLTVTTGVGISQIVFNAVGDSVTLIWTGGSTGWAVIGSHSATIS